jgi:hypothetical protein
VKKARHTTKPAVRRTRPSARKAAAPPERKPARDRRAPAPVTAAELRALRAEIESRMRRPKPREAPMRWNPDPEEVQKSVAQLVLTIVEFLRQLMERQAIRRMEQKKLTKQEVEAVGVALMTLERTVRDIAERFGLSPEDLNLDLGPLGKLI